MTIPATLETDRLLVTEQLGRPPRGMLDVVTRCPAGHPQVIRTAPLVGPGEPPEPFPTTYWLTCRALHRRLADLERRGLIRVLEERVAASARLRQQYQEDHAAYARERWALLDEADQARARQLGFEAILCHSGIGGLVDRRHLKCLHMHVAHHLARGSQVGRLLAEFVSFEGCPAP